MCHRQHHSSRHLARIKKKHGLRSHTARLCFAWTYRGETGLYFNLRGVVHCLWRSFLPWHPPPSYPACVDGWLQIWWCWAGSSDRRLAARGASVGPQREKPLSTAASVLCPVIVNGLRSLRDFLQSLWVICGRRWRTGLRCFPYPLSIPSLPLVAGKSLHVKRRGRDGGGRCARWMSGGYDSRDDKHIYSFCFGERKKTHIPYHG